MPVVILYLLKLSVSLAIVWLFYHLLLRKLTFYNLNRWYLLGYSILSFFIPFINIGWLVDRDPVAQPAVVKYIPVLWDFSGAVVPEAAPVVDVWDVVLLCLGLGAVFLTVRFLVRWVALRKLRAQARLLSDDGLRIFQVDRSITPFSFGRSIYINGELHTPAELDAIIRHEFVHVRQKHTVDILLMELFCMLNWYNPFIWLLRRDVRQNLEFIADNGVVQSGCDRKSYQYHLLRVAGSSRYCLANNFNFSSLKKRIVMMNKVKSAKLHLVKFLFILPFLSVLLLAFRSLPAVRAEAPVKAAEAPVKAVVTPVKVVLTPVMAVGDKAAALRPMAAAAARIQVRDTTPVKKKADEAIKVSGVLTIKSLGANRLVLVDGVTMPEGWDLNSISPNDIESVNILKGAQATRIFGPAGKDGVVAILTKKAAAGLGLSAVGPVDEVTVVGHPSRAATSATPADGASFSTNVHITGVTTVQGYAKPTGDTTGLPDVLYVVGGVEQTKLDLKKIDPQDIESINIYKDEEHTKKYGEKGRNGVIVVTLKKKEEKK